MAIVPNFSALPLTGYNPLSVTFTDLTTGADPSFSKITTPDLKNFGDIVTQGKYALASAYNDYVYLSSDSGANWTQQTGMGSHVWAGVAVSEGVSPMMYACNNSDGKIYKSTDQGANWTGVSVASNITKVRCSNDGSVVATLALSGHVWVSTNYGVIWNERTASPTTGSWYDLDMSDDGNAIIISLGTTVWISYDKGVTWTEQTSLSASLGNYCCLVVNNFDQTTYDFHVGGYNTNTYLQKMNSGVGTWSDETNVGRHAWTSLSKGLVSQIAYQNPRFIAAVGIDVGTSDYVYISYSPVDFSSFKKYVTSTNGLTRLVAISPYQIAGFNLITTIKNGGSSTLDLYTAIVHTPRWYIYSGGSYVPLSGSCFGPFSTILNEGVWSIKLNLDDGSTYSEEKLDYIEVLYQPPTTTSTTTTTTPEPTTTTTTTTTPEPTTTTTTVPGSIYYVNISTEYDGGGPHAGTVSDPYDYAEFAAKAVSENDIFKIRGGRPIYADLTKGDGEVTFYIEAWDLQVYGMWSIYSDDDDVSFSVGDGRVNGLRFDALYGDINIQGTIGNSFLQVKEFHSIYLAADSIANGCTLISTSGGEGRGFLNFESSVVFNDCIIDTPLSGLSATWNNCAFANETVPGTKNNCQLGWAPPTWPSGGIEEYYKSALNYDTILSGEGNPRPGIGYPSYTGYEKDLSGHSRDDIGAYASASTPEPTTTTTTTTTPEPTTTTTTPEPTTTTTTPSPTINRNLWANFSSSVLGSGTELSPFTYSQVRNYFNPDLGDSCGVIPYASDTINCEGIINIIDIDTVFSIKINITGKITVKVKDLVTIPWRIESADNINNDIYLVKNEVGYNISELEIKDFIFCQNS